MLPECSDRLLHAGDVGWSLDSAVEQPRPCELIERMAAKRAVAPRQLVLGTDRFRLRCATHADGPLGHRRRRLGEPESQTFIEFLVSLPEGALHLARSSRRLRLPEAITTCIK